MANIENSDFWIKKLHDKEKLLLSRSEIDALNAKNFEQKENDLNCLGKLNFLKGVVVRRTEVKKNQNEDLSEDNIESVLFPFEAVAISHESENKKYYHIFAVNTSGYVLKKDVAITYSENLWKYYLKPDKFYVVTANGISSNGVFPHLDMGVRMPAHEFGKVLLPCVEGNNVLSVRSEKILSLDGLNFGYLDYTYENILSLAFECLGSEYGWGGIFGKRDCSSFICEIMKVFGVVVGRNVSNQLKSGISRINISKMSVEGKNMLILSLPVGTLLSFDGHTAMYIGRIGNTAYIIHAVSKYINSEGEIEEAKKVTVTDTNIKRVVNGFSFMESFSDAILFSAK